MPEKIGGLLPAAKDIQRQAIVKQVETADESARRLAATETEKRALLGKPSGLSEDEKINLASTVIQRAAQNGLTEFQLYRFPNSLCIDHGRAIAQQEDGWEKTLTGIAQEIYQLWVDYLQPRGYRIRYQIIYSPSGVPGDISIVLSWNSWSAQPPKQSSSCDAISHRTERKRPRLNEDRSHRGHFRTEQTIIERFDAAAGIAAYPTPADALLIGSISEFARNGLVR